MNISSKTLNGLDLVILEGEVDMYVAPRLRDALLATCNRSSAAVGVDLKSVPYMDSSGIATLIEGLQWSKKEGKRFLLVGVQDTVFATLQLAKLDGIFDIYSSEEDALSGIA